MNVNVDVSAGALMRAGVRVCQYCETACRRAASW